MLNDYRKQKNGKHTVKAVLNVWDKICAFCTVVIKVWHPLPWAAGVKNLLCLSQCWYLRCRCAKLFCLICAIRCSVNICISCFLSPPVLYNIVSFV